MKIRIASKRIIISQPLSSFWVYFLGSWIMLLGTMVAYWLYSKLGITKKLWARGIWFSENDVLHVLLIFWMTYTATVVANRVKDYTVPILWG